MTQQSNKMDFSFKNLNTPQKGALLVSDPFETGIYFTRSVVLICNYDQEGTFGFVLNNYVNLSASDINKELLSYEGRIGIGGPVDKGNLFYIHQFEDLEGSEAIMEDLYFGGDFQEVLKRMNESADNALKVRFFIGYSGWDGGQLEAEIDQHAWIVVDNHTVEQVMDTTSDNLWKDMMSLQGTKYKILSDFPLNPTYN